MSRPCRQILIAQQYLDPTAVTALVALRDSLGFGARLAGVSRRILWELHAPDGEEIGRLLDALRRGGEIWNPNKERAHLRAPGERAERLGEPILGDPAWRFVLAWDPERDLDRVPVALAPYSRQGWRLARGVLWGLCWTEGHERERTEWTEDAVVCRGPRRGLLVHPHLQDHRPVGPETPVPWLPDRADRS